MWWKHDLGGNCSEEVRAASLNGVTVAEGGKSTSPALLSAKRLLLPLGRRPERSEFPLLPGVSVVVPDSVDSSGTRQM